MELRVDGEEDVGVERVFVGGDALGGEEGVGVGHGYVRGDVLDGDETSAETSAKTSVTRE